MSGLLALLRHSLRRQRTLLAAAYALLFAFQMQMILVARALEKANRFDALAATMPEFVGQWTKMMAASFRGLVLFGYSHPVVLIFMVGLAINIGTESAGEIESKFVDLMMSRPLSRTVPVLRTVVLLVLTIGGAVVLMMLGTHLGLRLFAPPSTIVPDAHTILRLATNLAMEVLAWGAIALAMASTVNRRSAATGACGLLALTMFVLDYVGRFWDPAKGISRISPFHYFSPFQMIGGEPLAMTDLAVLAGIFLAGSLVGGVVYSRRDL